ncbi:helix-turn-helix transcriptional regulator [Streptomyces sp. NPDC006684]|uniref:helix-turn-helix transcriptional regulator n=1 Tax=Streptomyces sp. NPDC006684 TaxID=3154477 RepID=UPI00345505E9
MTTTVPQPLTPVQLHVIAGLARGLTAPQIAADLRITHYAVYGRIASAAALVGITAQAPALVNYAYAAGYLRRLAPEPRPPAVLTPKLREVLRLTAEGRALREIARDLGLSVNAANERRRRLFALLGARSRAHAVALAWQAGLLGPRP